MLKMSDWEDEYDENGVAIYNLPVKSALTGCKLPVDRQYQRENVYCGVSDRCGFGSPGVEKPGRSCEGTQRKSRGGGDDGRPRPWTAGRRIFGDAKSDSSPPVTLSVESVKIGRVIGTFAKHLYIYRLNSIIHNFQGRIAKLHSTLPLVVLRWLTLFGVV